MAIVMLALGSRGDVQPLATLAGALGARGVPVRVVALAEYAGLVQTEAPGATFVPVPARLSDAVRRGRRDELLAGSPAGQLLLLQRWTAGLAAALVDAVLPVVDAGDVVLTGVLTRGLAEALASARGCRMATVVYTGQVPTLEPESHFFAPFLTGWAPYDRWGVRLNWSLATAAGRAVTHEARRRLGLPRAGFRAVSARADQHPVVVAASPLLVPTPSDWPAGVHQTGYLASPERPFTPDSALAGFLGGDPPVYVGFGSFTHFSGPEDLDLIVRAADLAGLRILTPAPPGVASGPVSPRVFAQAPVPHRWLFPRVAATVHHGGAGTTHEALLAGVPSGTVPFGVDQPYHGRRLHALGVGPAPLPLRRLSARRLARLLVDLVGSSAADGYRRRAAGVAGALREEGGLARTVSLLAEWGYLA